MGACEVCMGWARVGGGAPGDPAGRGGARRAAPSARVPARDTNFMYHEHDHVFHTYMNIVVIQYVLGPTFKADPPCTVHTRRR